MLKFFLISIWEGDVSVLALLSFSRKFSSAAASLMATVMEVQGAGSSQLLGVQVCRPALSRLRQYVFRVPATVWIPACTIFLLLLHRF